MNVNLILNIVYGVLFAYFIIVLFKSVVRLVHALTEKFIVYLRLKKLNENVDAEYTDYLKERDNVK